MNTLGKLEVVLDCSLGNHAHEHGGQAAAQELSKFVLSENASSMSNATLGMNGISPIPAPVLSTSTTASSPDTRVSYPARTLGEFAPIA